MKIAKIGFFSERFPGLKFSLLALGVCFFFSMNAQVADISVQKKAREGSQQSTLNPKENVFLGGSIQKKKAHLQATPLPFRFAGLRHQRISVEINSQFKERRFKSIKSRFDNQRLAPLIGEGETRTPESRLVKGFERRMVFGTNEVGDGNHVWKAHLQRSDFEMLSQQLSLNDINRFQFRKNRKNGDHIPATSAGSESIEK